MKKDPVQFLRQLDSKPHRSPNILLLFRYGDAWDTSSFEANGISAALETEQDLLSQIQDVYELETDSLGGNPVPRRLKDNEEIRLLAANLNTIKAMERLGLISPGKSREPLTIVWRLKIKRD